MAHVRAGSGAGGTDGCSGTSGVPLHLIVASQGLGLASRRGTAGAGADHAGRARWQAFWRACGTLLNPGGQLPRIGWRTSQLCRPWPPAPGRDNRRPYDAFSGSALETEPAPRPLDSEQARVPVAARVSKGVPGALPPDALWRSDDEAWGRRTGRASGWSLAAFAAFLRPGDAERVPVR